MSETLEVQASGLFTAAQKGGTRRYLPSGWQNEPVFSELLPRTSRLNELGAIYSTGMQLTSISNATFTTATALSATQATAATATPIVGLWNKPTSGMNAHISKLSMQVVITALQATGCGGFVWVGYPGLNTITVASQAVPVSRKTYLAQGSQCAGLSGLALTGLSNLGVYLGVSGVNGGAMLNLSNLQTAVGLDTAGPPAFEQVDGDLIVPPGAVLGLFCSTTPVAHSAAASLTWAELPA